MDHVSDTSSTPPSDHPGEKKAIVQVIDDLVQDRDAVNNLTMSTRADQENMDRMGKQQQLVRRFETFSVASLAALATASWELGIFMITPGLLDGGNPNLMYSLIWNFLCFGFIYISLAEMASMAPISGAQYHWVSEFAPESCQRILSYLTGWTSTLAWQAGNCLGVFVTGSVIQCMIQIGNPDYAFPAWHAVLLVAATMVVAYIGNTYGAKFLPYWQNVVMVIHCVGYIAFIIPIWINAPKATHRQVWLDYENDGGWPTMAMAVLIGQIAGINSQVGVDTAAHMSEEVTDAAKSVPKAMMLIWGVNTALWFPVLVTLCYHMPSSEDALGDPTAYPVIYIMRQSMSDAGILAMLFLILLILTASNISYLAAVTRDIFAFARDEGLPFSSWIAKVDPKTSVPNNACLATSVIAIALALIYLGSPVAFYAITSLCTAALLQCYCLSIGCILWRRIYHPETLPPAQFSLGKWGIPINAFAFVFSFWCFFWSFWPQAYPVTASGFNWASVIFGSTIILAMIDFTFRGRHKYFGPVKIVKGRFDN